MNHEGTKNTKEESNRISAVVVDSALEVHKQLGPGLLESVYEQALAQEFTLRGVAYEQQFSLPVYYKGKLLETHFRIDFLVENLVILELKAVRKMDPIYDAQLLTYLKISGLWLGILLNFNVYQLREGIKRVVNG